jgi:glycosyltransferase involved in cell wall biosynthesis
MVGAEAVVMSERGLRGSTLMDSARDTGRHPQQTLGGSRVLVVMPSIPVQGMERANLEIMRVLRRRGADVLVVTERTHGQRVQRAVEQAGARWVAVRITDVYEERLHLTWRLPEQLGVLKAWARAAWGIWRTAGSYRPTHVYVTNLSYGLYALLVLVSTRAKVVFRLPNPPTPAGRGHKQRLARWLWRRCLRLADVVVCNCQYTAALARREGVAGERLRLIHNIVPLAVARDIGDAPRLDPQRFTVVYLGRIRPEKGITELVSAATRLVAERPDVDFVLAGEYAWKNDFARDVIGRLEVEGLAARIRFVGEVQDVHGLLDQCQLHVCPSTSANESFPNVVLEAKAHGVPSVVFPTGGLPEAVTHLVDGYVCPERSAASLYDGLKFFVDDASALRKAGEAAKASAACYSPERIGDLWADVFRSGADDSRG